MPRVPHTVSVHNYGKYSIYFPRMVKAKRTQANLTPHARNLTKCWVCNEGPTQHNVLRKVIHVVWRFAGNGPFSSCSDMRMCWQVSNNKYATPFCKRGTETIRLDLRKDH